MNQRVLVIGNGMVGSRVVQELLERDLDRRLRITVVGDEPGEAYNRMLLSNVLAGATKADQITLASEASLEFHGVALRSGRTAVGIDRADKMVTLDDGSTLPYDLLVLATGSEAVVPPVPGLAPRGDLIDGVGVFRTLADCARIDHAARNTQHAIVVGGGLLGLEAARGLAGRGVPVTVIQRGSRLMEQQLDSTASRVLVRTLRDAAIEIVLDADVERVRGANAVQGVTLSDGTQIDADLLVLCCGVRPRVDVARNAGLDVRRGIVVDDQLRSVTDPNVFAVGECAEHRGQIYGLVAPGWDQARIAADVIVGRAAAAYTGSAVVTRLKAAGVELAAMGEASTDDDDDVCFVDGHRRVYQKLVVRDGRLVGAILLGDTRMAATIVQIFDRGATVPIDRAALLMVRRNSPATTVQSPTLLPGHATICQCNGVTKTAICDAWQSGARSVGEIANRTRATTGCGSCKDAVEGLADWLTAADTEAQAPNSADLEVVLA